MQREQHQVIHAQNVLQGSTLAVQGTLHVHHAVLGKRCIIPIQAKQQHRTVMHVLQGGTVLLQVARTHHTTVHAHHVLQEGISNIGVRASAISVYKGRIPHQQAQQRLMCATTV